MDSTATPSSATSRRRWRPPVLRLGLVLVGALAAALALASMSGWPAPAPQGTGAPGTAPAATPPRTATPATRANAAPAARPVASALRPTSQPSEPTPQVIAAAGDIACDPTSHSFRDGRGAANACHMRDTANLLLRLDPVVVLTLGDNQYENGTLAKFRRSYDPGWGRLKGRTRPAPGNHDYGTAGAAGYFDYFGAAAGPHTRGYYSFDVGAWHLIALNSECGHVGGCGKGSRQERWLRADLAAHRAACTLAYWHKPRFSSGMHGDDATYTAFWQALYEAGADIVLVGHDHDYERFAPQRPDGVADPTTGIRQFVVGTGGKTHYGFRAIRRNSKVRNSGTFGVLKLVLRPSSYDWRFVPEPGRTFTDAGRAACH